MKSRILSAILIILFLSACNGVIEVGIEHSPTGNTPTLASAPTATLAQPAATDFQADVLPQPTAPEPQAAVTDQAPTQNTAKIYLIGVNDAGQAGLPVGCGDSAIPVPVAFPPTAGVLKSALVALLSVKDQYYGQSGLYNALYQSDLQVDSVSIAGGKASVYPTGSMTMGGECDTPRVQAQLEQTVRQFPTVTDAAIFINGKPLAEALSLKGTEPQPAPTDQAPAQNMVKIFLIAVDDAGQAGTPVGCGDSAVPVQVEVTPTAGVLKAALVALLSIKDQHYGQSGLYNALYQSNLQVDGVSVVGGQASVTLSGTLTTGGTCDAPRVQAQLEQTILQFPTVTEAAIYINGKTLAEALSQ